MSGPAAVRLAICAFAATVLLMLLGAVAAIAHGGNPPGQTLELIPFALLLLGMPLLGVLVARAQPGNPVGWIFSLTPVLVSLSLGFGTYASWAQARGATGWLATSAAVIAGFGWMIGLALFGLMVPALFPTGRVAGRRWRWLVPADLAILAVVAVAIAVQPSSSTADIQNPLAVQAASSAWVIGAVALAVIALMVCGAVSSLVRYRRARGVERQQMRLVLWAIVLTFVLFFVNSALGGFVAGYGLTYALIPTSVGVAMLRYRLYDVDLIIRRTVTYACLVAALAAIYLAAIMLIGEIVRGGFGQSGALAVTISTLLAAAAFQPLNSRIRRTVDRRFHRAGYDPGIVVEQFSALLREEIDLDSLSGDLLDVVSKTVQPRDAGIWLRPVTLAERGTDTP